MVLYLRNCAVVLEILAEATLPFTNMAIVLHEFNRAQVLHHLVAKKCLDSETHGRSVFDGERLAIHLIGKDGLRMESVGETDAFVILAGALLAALRRLAFQIVGAVENRIARPYRKPWSLG